MRFVFVRHGETIWNVLGLMQGSADIELTDKGILQAVEFSNSAFFQDLGFDAAFSSDLKRASKTAEILCAAREVNLTFAPALRERNLGDFEGRPLNEFLNSLGNWSVLTESEKWNSAEYNSEPFSSVLSRVKEFLKEIARTSATADNATFLIVTHSDLMRSLYVSLMQEKGGAEFISLANMVGFTNLGHMVVQEIPEGDDLGLQLLTAEGMHFV